MRVKCLNGILDRFRECAHPNHGAPSASERPGRVTVDDVAPGIEALSAIAFSILLVDESAAYFVNGPHLGPIGPHLVVADRWKMVD